MSEQDQPMHKDEAGKPRVIESASATTSRDNQTGAAPVVITLVVLALLVAIGCATTSGIMKFAELAVEYEDYDSYGSGSNAYPYDDEDLDDLKSDLEDLRNELNGNSDYSDTELTEDNVFDVELYCLDDSVSDYVFSSDYSGSQKAVASYVQAFAKADDDATTQVVSHLRAAASAADDETRADELSQAAQLCEQAKTDLAAIELPAEGDISGSSADDILSSLQEAQDCAAKRWEAFGKIVAIMASPSGHYASELDELDATASDVTNIALDLADALWSSANDK